MANPNIVNVTSIYGKTTGGPMGASAVSYDLVATGEIAKISSLRIINFGASAATGSVYITDTDNGSTTYSLAHEISVPPNSTMIIVDKNSSVYLEEGHNLTFQASDNTSLRYTISYEVIS